MPCSECPPRVHCCKFKYSKGFVFVGAKDADNIRKKYGADYRKCQKPPVTDWWHVAERNTASWFLSMLRNFPYSKSELAFSHQLETGGKFLTFLHLKKISGVLASFMKKEPSYSEGYMRHTQLKDGKLPVLKIKKNGDCIFLKRGACVIYKDRPLVCQLYPYWFLPAEKMHIIPHDPDLKCRLLKEKNGRAQLTKSELKRCINLAKKIMEEERDYHKHHRNPTTLDYRPEFARPSGSGRISGIHRKR